MARVIIPSNIDDKLKLAEAVYARHQADEASSPIGGLGWTKTGLVIALT